jgi:Protein of Unknown function (DUF2784)
MHFRLLAEFIVCVHIAFIAFAVLGGLLVLRWPRIVMIHLSTFVWAAYVEFSGRICPLTPLENHFRVLAGEAGYGTGFIEHYALPLIYPSDLTRTLQVILGGAVVLVNTAIYALIMTRHILRSRIGAAR